jgi:hypothetical protein
MDRLTLLVASNVNWIVVVAAGEAVPLAVLFGAPTGVMVMWFQELIRRSGTGFPTESSIVRLRENGGSIGGLVGPSSSSPQPAINRIVVSAAPAVISLNGVSLFIILILLLKWISTMCYDRVSLDLLSQLFFPI